MFLAFIIKYPSEDQNTYGKNYILRCPSLNHMFWSAIWFIFHFVWLSSLFCSAASFNIHHPYFCTAHSLFSYEILSFGVVKLNNFFLTFDVVGFVVELLAVIILGPESVVTVVVDIKKIVRRMLSVQSGTSTVTCTTIIATKLIQIPLSLNLTWRRP